MKHASLKKRDHLTARAGDHAATEMQPWVFRLGPVTTIRNTTTNRYNSTRDKVHDNMIHSIWIEMRGTGDYTVIHALHAYKV